MTACLNGQLDLVRTLVRRGADVNVATPKGSDEHVWMGSTISIPAGGRTPLMMAAFRGHVGIARALLDAGARVDAVSDRGDTALCEAVSSKDARMLSLLVGRGANVNQRAMFTALYRATEAGEVALTRWLLARGARVDARIWTGATPLMAAARIGSTALVKLLLKHGADPTLTDRDKQTVLHLAVMRRLPPGEHDDPSAIARVLLGAGAKVDAKNRDGATALVLLAKRYDDPVAAVDVVLAAGARVELKDATGSTPLSHACAMNQLDVALRLLAAGARAQVRDRKGMTPLLHVARNGYRDLAYVLMAHGVEPAERRRALALARRSKRDDLVRVLEGEVLAAERIPRSVHAPLERANALYLRKRYDAALAIYQQLPASFEGRIFAVLSNAGYCLQQLGRNDEAMSMFERALTLEPSRASHLLRAICYACFECGDWQAMRQAAARGTELSTADDYLWQQLAIAYKKLGSHHEAIAAGERAVALNPRNAFAWMNLADDYAKVGDPRRVDTLARSLELAPELRSSLERDDIDALKADRRHAALVRQLRLT